MNSASSSPLRAPGSWRPVATPFLAAWGLMLLGCGQIQGRAAESWEDISGGLQRSLTNAGSVFAWPGGFSGVVVNRTNGHVTVKAVGLGLWQSTDLCRSWRRIDRETVSGRDETGWATSVDQNAPGRMASFSLDGAAGWTTDGAEWRRFADLGRNWDYGSVDWSEAIPRTIIAARHETTPPGEVYLTRDAGVTWRKLSLHLSENRGRVSMIGALDPTTLIHGRGEGIRRSTDDGETWTQVSTVDPQTRIPVCFGGACYLGTSGGLLVSKDLGRTWHRQGAAVDIWQGPFFGRDEKECLVVGTGGAFVSRDAGATWIQAAGLKSKEAGFLFGPNWFGCYAWDPIHGYLYVSSMGNPVYRLKL